MKENCIVATKWNIMTSCWSKFDHPVSFHIISTEWYFWNSSSFFQILVICWLCGGRIKRVACNTISVKHGLSNGLFSQESKSLFALHSIYCHFDKNRFFQIMIPCQNLLAGESSDSRNENDVDPQPCCQYQTYQIYSYTWFGQQA